MCAPYCRKAAWHCVSSSDFKAYPVCVWFAGQEPGDSVIDGMMKEAPGPLNFTMFLTLFGEKLTGKLLSMVVTMKCAQ